MRILVVDDVGLTRHYLDRLLTQNGHSVVTATSGSHALDLLKQENAIQVVITDLLMPGMDGIELFKAAQRIDRFDDNGPLPPPAFFLITALRPTSSTPRREANLLQQAVDLGFSEVLQKPVDNELLLRKLSALERKILRGANAKAPSEADLASVEDHVRRDIEKLLACDDQERLASLSDMLHGFVARLEQALKALGQKTPEKSTSIDQTLHTLQQLTDSVGEDTEAALTMCRQLESQAQQLKQKLAKM